MARPRLFGESGQYTIYSDSQKFLGMRKLKSQETELVGDIIG
jgi:hypothetical protein